MTHCLLPSHELSCIRPGARDKFHHSEPTIFITNEMVLTLRAAIDHQLKETTPCLNDGNTRHFVLIPGCFLKHFKVARDLEMQRHLLPALVNRVVGGLATFEDTFLQHAAAYDIAEHVIDTFFVVPDVYGLGGKAMFEVHSFNCCRDDDQMFALELEVCEPDVHVIMDPYKQCQLRLFMHKEIPSFEVDFHPVDTTWSAVCKFCGIQNAINENHAQLVKYKLDGDVCVHCGHHFNKTKIIMAKRRKFSHGGQ